MPPCAAAEAEGRAAEPAERLRPDRQKQHSAAGTLVLGYGSLKDEACASVGETLKKVCTAAREASVTV